MYTSRKAPSRDGATALYYASGLGLDAVAEALLEAGADPDRGQRRSARRFAASRPRVAASSPRPFSPSASLDRVGGTPLIYASGMGRASTVTLLLRHGAHVEKAADDGTRPLHAAVSEGHAAVVAALLTLPSPMSGGGADANAPLPATGATPLALAVSGGHREVLRLLLGAGDADPHRVAADTGAGPLHVACQMGDHEAVGMLVAKAKKDQGARALVRAETVADGAGFRAAPLYLAAKGGCARCAEVLLEAGADPDAGVDGPGGATALLAAVEAGDVGVCRTLLEGGASPDLGATRGGSQWMRSPLLLAVVSQRAEVAALLLAKGANCQVVVG